MKLPKGLIAVSLSFLFSFFVISTVQVQSIQAQDSKIALQRGYRTGYSDGYMAGYRDSIDSLAKNYVRHAEYGKADRAFNKEYGTVDDYKNGYKQGFESGYDTGFEKKSFEATIPANISKSGNVNAPAYVATAIERTPAVPTYEKSIEKNVAPSAPVEKAGVPEPVAQTYSESQATQNAPAIEEPMNVKSTFQQVSDAVIIIPRDTELIVEITGEISTDKSKVGDTFAVRIVSPSEIGGAIVQGRIMRITRPGRIKRRAEITLSFDRIVLNDTRWSNFNAILTEVLPVKGDNVKLVDNEGTAIGQRSYKSDGVKVGAATGTGLVIGAVAGGPVGAVIGAGVGAAVGVGASAIERGKNISLNNSQQLRIKTVYETQIR